MARQFAQTVAQAIAIWLVGTVSALAADIPAATIAVLDYQAVLRASAAGQQIHAEFDARRTEFQQAMANKEEQLKRTEVELQRQRTILAPDAYESRRRDFEREVIESRRQAQDQIRQLEAVRNNGLAQIQQAIIPIIQRLTGEMEFNVVVDKTQVLFAKRQLDITERVVKELDAALPRVTLPKTGQ